MKILVFLVVGLCCFSCCFGQAGTNLPALKVSQNGRYLTSGNRPFFWLGDTGWLLLSKLNREETTKYLDNRKQKGFNIIQVMVLHTLSAVSANGDSALIGKNLATLNLGDYWKNLDEVIGLAAERGIYLALVPVWGSNVKAGQVNSEQAEMYARFLSSRYKDKPNIVWMNGGDVKGSDSIRVWQTIGETLKKFDPGHLITFHPFGRTQSSTWFHNESWLDFNMFQSGHRCYDQDTARNEFRYGEDNWRYVQADLSKEPAKPSLDGEPSYEGIPHGLHDTLQPRWTDNDVRRYAYWSVFSGACGFTYGNNSVMQFYKLDGNVGAYGARQPWNEALNTHGAAQMIHLKELMENYHFEKLIPDQSVFLNQGSRYDHLVALRGAGCLLVYTFNGRPVKLNLLQWKGSKLKMGWFSPRNGLLTGEKILRQRDVIEFDPPGMYMNGNDWVLILKIVK